MKNTVIRSAWPLASVTVRAYCKCGDAIHTTMNDVEGINTTMEIFAECHQEPGCGPCDSKTARKARIRRERKP